MFDIIFKLDEVEKWFTIFVDEKTNSPNCEYKERLIGGNSQMELTSL
jgi:hypothetical protein